MASVGALVVNGEYSGLKQVVQAANQIMMIRQDFIQKPVVDMIEGKYWLFSQNNSEKARKRFESGAKFAKMMGDFVLSDKIMKEWENDLAMFEQQQSNT